MASVPVTFGESAAWIAGDPNLTTVDLASFTTTPSPERMILIMVYYRAVMPTAVENAMVIESEVESARFVELALVKL